MNERIADYVNNHTPVIGFGGFFAAWTVGQFNSYLQVAVLACTLLITAPKAYALVKSYALKLWACLRRK